MVEQRVRRIHIVASKRLRMIPNVPLAQGLLGGWHNTLNRAFKSAANVKSRPIVSVHDFRKSIRRCRAVLRLLRRIISDDIYQSLRVTLREVHRATSSLRDRDVVLDTLHRLPLSPEWIERASARIDSAAPVSTDRAAIVLNEMTSRFEAIERDMSIALEQNIRRRQLREGVRSLYRRARRDMRDTQKNHGDESLHDWRKRTKELKYVVELLTDGGYEGEGREMRAQFGQLNRELGKIVDLLVLKDYVRAHLMADFGARLLAVIASEEQRHRLIAMAHGRQLFGKRSETFAHELMKTSKRLYQQHVDS